MTLTYILYFQGQEYAAQYMLEYQRREGDRWIRYRDRFNKDVSKTFTLQ